MASATPTLDDLTVLNAELAALVRARIPLEPELRRLGTQLPRGAGALAERLAGRMESGIDLAAAIEAEGAALPETYRAIVTAGLASGDLPAALESIAESTRRLADIRRTTGVAMIVPAAVVVLASVLLALVLSVVMGGVAWIAPRTLHPWQESMLSPFVRWILLAAIPGLAIFGPLVWWLLSRGADGGRWNLLGWIPGVAHLRRLGSAATLAEVLRMMVESGAPLDRALSVAGGATSDNDYRKASLELAECSRRGGDLSEAENPKTKAALAKMPPLVRSALLKSGRPRLLVAALAQAHRSYQARAQAVRDSLTNYVPALLTVGVAGTVTALYTIGLMWPYTQMLRTMADGMWR